MSDLVSARAAAADDIARTVSIVEAEQATTRTERGGRWHLDHDGPSESAQVRHGATLSDDRQTLVVGCIDNVVVGVASAALSTTTTGQLCMIDELVVHPDARAVGVGSAILEEVRHWALSHNCEAIESQVLPGNRAAKNFFERVGMKTRKMRVSADL